MMTTNKPEVVAWGVPNSRLTEQQPYMCLLHTQKGTQYPELLDPLIRLSDYEALQSELEQSIKRQASAAKSGMDAAKKAGMEALRIAEKMRAESRPEVLESERAANAQLTEENEALQAECDQLRKDAELGAVVWKFIDRMNDVCPQFDPADRIISEFTAKVNPIIRAKSND